MQLNFGKKRKSGHGQVSHPTSFSCSYFSFTLKHICGRGISISVMMHRASLRDLSKALPYPSHHRWRRRRSRGCSLPFVPRAAQISAGGEKQRGWSRGDAAASGEAAGRGQPEKKGYRAPERPRDKQDTGSGAEPSPARQNHRSVVPSDARSGAGAADRHRGCRHRAGGHGEQQSPDLPTPRDALPILTLHSPPQPLAGGN